MFTKVQQKWEMSALNSLHGVGVDKVVHYSICWVRRQKNKQENKQPNKRSRGYRRQAQTVISAGPQAQGAPGPHPENHNSAKVGKQSQRLERDLAEPSTKQLLERLIKNWFRSTDASKGSTARDRQRPSVALTVKAAIHKLASRIEVCREEVALGYALPSEMKGFSAAEQLF